MRASIVLVLAALGCRKSEEPGPPWDGPLDLGPVVPFPNTGLIDTSGHLAIPADALGELAVPDPARLAWRTGFSPSQTSVLRLPGIDAAGLPTAADIRPGEGSVVLLDLDTGAWLPVMAELDAYPEAVDPALLIRPLQVLPSGHRIGVAVTTDAVARPDTFDQLVKGQAEGNEVTPGETRDLVDAFEAVGLPADRIAVAWQFPVDDPGAPLRSALAAMSVSGAWSFDFTRDRDDGDQVAPTTWRTGTGSFEVTDFLVDDRLLDLDATGNARPTGTTEAHLYVHIPESVRNAPAGSVPVLVFGHGIFGNPELYLDDPEDPSGVLALADEAGFIVVGTKWRGLTSTDVVEVVAAANDFTLFPNVPERLVQGQVNTRTLVELVVSGAFSDDPLFLGDQGQKLPMEGRAIYYGISLGSIEGTVLLANGAPLDAAAFHVGGAMWSTMLERSSNWTTFEHLMVDSVPEAADRQMLYAMSQLWWDYADPATYASALVDQPMLYQVSIGDEQVPNLTSEAFARSIGLPLLTPEHHAPFGFETVAGPLQPGSRAIVQFDPMVPLPTVENRPAEVTHAHHIPRLWDGARRQVIDHLAVGSEGQIVHHCGAAVCSETNQGD